MVLPSLSRPEGQGQPDPAQPGARDPVPAAERGGGGRVRPYPGRGRRRRVRAPPAGPGHPGPLRAASPQGRPRGAGRRPPLSRPAFAERFAAALTLLLAALLALL